MDGTTSLQLDRYGVGVKNCKWTTLKSKINIYALYKNGTISRGRSCIFSYEEFSLREYGTQ